MIEFKIPLIKVRCSECKEANSIHMQHIGTDNEKRSIGIEHEYIYRGQLKCVNCSEQMRLVVTIYEFPRGILNYYDIDKKSCYVLDKINDSSFTILNKSK